MEPLSEIGHRMILLSNLAFLPFMIIFGELEARRDVAIAAGCALTLLVIVTVGVRSVLDVKQSVKGC